MDEEEMVTTLTRKLGRSGVMVSVMGLGCRAIGGPFWSDSAAVGWSNGYV
jgi:aryl-alcohol dehydrogenase-like predicted oxidoreductase